MKFSLLQLLWSQTTASWPLWKWRSFNYLLIIQTHFHLLSFCFQTSVTIEIRYQSMDGAVGVWSDGEFLDVPDDRDGMFAFETDSLLSGQSHGSGTSPGRSLQGSIPTFRKWVKHTDYLHDNFKVQWIRLWNAVDLPLNINVMTTANKMCWFNYVLQCLGGH